MVNCPVCEEPLDFTTVSSSFNANSSGSGSISLLASFGPQSVQGNVTTGSASGGAVPVQLACRHYMCKPCARCHSHGGVVTCPVCWIDTTIRASVVAPGGSGTPSDPSNKMPRSHSNTSSLLLVHSEPPRLSSSGSGVRVEKEVPGLASTMPFHEQKRTSPPKGGLSKEKKGAGPTTAAVVGAPSVSSTNVSALSEIATNSAKSVPSSASESPLQQQHTETGQSFDRNALASEAAGPSNGTAAGKPTNNRTKSIPTSNHGSTTKATPVVKERQKGPKPFQPVPHDKQQRPTAGVGGASTTVADLPTGRTSAEPKDNIAFDFVPQSLSTSAAASTIFTRPPATATGTSTAASNGYHTAGGPAPKESLTPEKPALVAPVPTELPPSSVLPPAAVWPSAAHYPQYQQPRSSPHSTGGASGEVAGGRRQRAREPVVPVVEQQSLPNNSFCEKCGIGHRTASLLKCVECDLALCLRCDTAHHMGRWSGHRREAVLSTSLRGVSASSVPGAVAPAPTPAVPSTGHAPTHTHTRSPSPTSAAVVAGSYMSGAGASERSPSLLSTAVSPLTNERPSQPRQTTVSPLEAAGSQHLCHHEHGDGSVREHHQHHHQQHSGGHVPASRRSSDAGNHIGSQHHHHQLALRQGAGAGLGQAFPSLPFCSRPRHERHRLELYCLEDCMALCAMCSVDDARRLVGKTVLPVEDAVAAVRAKQQEWLETQSRGAAATEDTIAQLDLVLEELEAESVADLDATKQGFNAIRHRLDRLQSEVLGKVQERKTKNIQQLLEHRRLLVERRDAILANAKPIAQIVTDPSLAEVSPTTVLNLRKPDEVGPAPSPPSLTRLLVRFNSNRLKDEDFVRLHTAVMGDDSPGDSRGRSAETADPPTLPTSRMSRHAQASRPTGSTSSTRSSSTKKLSGEAKYPRRSPSAASLVPPPKASRGQRSSSTGNRPNASAASISSVPPSSANASASTVGGLVQSARGRRPISSGGSSTGSREGYHPYPHATANSNRDAREYKPKWSNCPKPQHERHELL